MRIGFTSLYAWRPHVEHIHYLAVLAREAGHSVSFLTCDSDLSNCYTRELRPSRHHFTHCARCRIGGIRSFESRDVRSIKEMARDHSVVPAGAEEWCQSSASTLGRFESDTDFASPQFQEIAHRLDAPTRRTYSAARQWIEDEKLDAICLFNGRMDGTRAILEAARHAGRPFASVERTWFGDGLQILPGENCLGLGNVDKMMLAWRDKPLSRDQALRAVGHIASRFLRRNDKEWRAYNKSAVVTGWPSQDARRRILLVPGSRNEVWGHPDWETQWPEHTAAYDALIDKLGLDPDEVVLRCHPNWGELIGAVDGSKAENHYTDWAKLRGIHCIGSKDTTSTLGLIEQCDAVVVSGGSAALEAGILGKQVIAVAPSVYQQAGFQSDADSPTALRELVLQVSMGEEARRAQEAHVARQTLRFAHTMVYRLAQFVKEVRCVSTTRYEYFKGADLARLPDLLTTGVLRADDDEYSTDTAGEDEVLAMIAARQWQRLIDVVPGSNSTSERLAVQRRWFLRPVDGLRDMMPRGDL